METLPNTLPSKVEDIQKELIKLEQIKRDTDEKAVLREQLAHMMSELCRNALPAQVVLFTFLAIYFR